MGFFIKIPYSFHTKPTKVFLILLTSVLFYSPTLPINNNKT